MTATTGRFALSGPEYASTAVAAAASTGGYLTGGSDYLARGVVGDLVGLLLLGAFAVAARARARHEAAVCLVLIGAVLLLGPQWPLRLPEPFWWALFSIGLVAYLAVRRYVCHHQRQETTRCTPST